MLTAAPIKPQDSSRLDWIENQLPETIETRLWLEEYLWLYGLLKSELNVGPVFRFPDLISACVSLVFARPGATTQIFTFLATEVVARPLDAIRRRESLWRQQYELLLDLQRSPANRHPNPKFQLDHLTTACVALCRLADDSGRLVLHQARINMAERATQKRSDPQSDPTG
jgi:hypothetical protein